MKKNTKTGLTGALCIVLLGAALLVTAGCGNKGSQTRHVIAILPVTNPPDENVGIQLRTVVISALLKHKQKKYFSIVDTTFIDRILEQHRFEASDWSNPEKVAEIGLALNADIIGIIDYKRIETKSDPLSKLMHGEEFRGNCSVNFLDVNTMVVMGAVALSDNLESMYLQDSGLLSALSPAIKKIKFDF